MGELGELLHSSIYILKVFITFLYRGYVSVQAVCVAVNSISSQAVAFLQEVVVNVSSYSGETLLGWLNWLAIVRSLNIHVLTLP